MEEAKLAKEKEEADKRAALPTEEARIDFDMRKAIEKLHLEAADRLKIKKLSLRE